MLLIVHELVQSSKHTHFTIPESVWNLHSSFYESFGFEMKGFAEESYRRGNRELFCEASTRDILQACLGKIYALNQSLIRAKCDAGLTETAHHREQLFGFSGDAVCDKRGLEIAPPTQGQGDLTAWSGYLTMAEASFKISRSVDPEVAEHNWEWMPETKAVIDRQERGSTEPEDNSVCLRPEGQLKFAVRHNQRPFDRIHPMRNVGRTPQEELLAALSSALQAVYSVSV
jgi:hypothetical protein